jgi:hypothetical protein
MKLTSPERSGPAKGSGAWAATAWVRAPIEAFVLLAAVVIPPILSLVDNRTTIVIIALDDGGRGDQNSLEGLLIAQVTGMEKS